MMPTAIVAYLALFATVGFLFVLASLLLGKFLRAHAPNPQKTATYECGEVPVGPGTVQFDLRFYVVALLFLIFEVEVAFFFPPATIFGKATQAMAQERASLPCKTSQNETPCEFAACNRTDSPLFAEFSPRWLALITMFDLGVFFAVLLVGFAYIWRRGDLDWVRAVRHPSITSAASAQSEGRA